ncbi:MAG: hypothetical protein PHT58_01090 [Eubacteriales bacterium]|nr:hypothetical protein [Eubacteriales bacterium]
MDIDGRRVADKEAMAYRDNVEYIRGFEKAMTEDSEISQEYLRRLRWRWAIDKVRSKLRVYSPQKEVFFCEYYGLDRPLRASEKRDSRMIKLSIKLFIGQSTLYKWKEQILDDIVLAATQAGVYHPFSE